MSVPPRPVGSLARVTTLAVNFLSPESLIATFGLIGILLIIFAETGLLIGFFLPGDSLLFLAGVAASGAATELAGTQLPIVPLLVGAAVCAIAGAQVGHLFGAKVGPRLFSRPESRFFKQEYVDSAEHYFTRFGPAKAVILARFVPIVRTFLNPVAGVLKMPTRTFLLWNVIGGLIWTQSVILLGYGLGDSIAGSIDKYLLPGVAAIIIVSVLPIALEVVRNRRKREFKVDEPV
jgi:membrane-associated protein